MRGGRCWRPSLEGCGVRAREESTRSRVRPGTDGRARERVQVRGGVSLRRRPGESGAVGESAGANSKGGSGSGEGGRKEGEIEVLREMKRRMN
jgi:hypothetical protein